MDRRPAHDVVAVVLAVGVAATVVIGSIAAAAKGVSDATASLLAAEVGAAIGILAVYIGAKKD